MQTKISATKNEFLMVIMMTKSMAVSIKRINILTPKWRQLGGSLLITLDWTVTYKWLIKKCIRLRAAEVGLSGCVTHVNKPLMSSATATCQQCYFVLTGWHWRMEMHGSPLTLVIQEHYRCQGACLNVWFLSLWRHLSGAATTVCRPIIDSDWKRVEEEE